VSSTPPSSLEEAASAPLLSSQDDSPASPIPPSESQSIQLSHTQLSRPSLSRLVLTGFMGAGKSTVGPLLATRLGWTFLDVDTQIESDQGASIAQLFAQHGEPWFRDVEHTTIRQLLDENHPGPRHLVLALGGGAIEDHRTLALLLGAENTRLIHLEATLATVLDRCRDTEAQRPILRDHANLEARYGRRLPLYRQAHLNLPVDTLSPEAVADTLLMHFFPATQRL
jgi:shikimate kinase